ncbi:MAG TPA: EAL domain-containing protein [Nocardioidaceae bacterium]|nr:EAL domain-containing protein [Nocardioidaceae bacterium]
MSTQIKPAVEASPATPVVVARQPVVDADRNVIGFELLYRPVDDQAPQVDGEQMTARVVLGALSIGIEQLAGDKLMFCNAERGVLTGATPLSLPPARTVVEILETVHIDDEALEGARGLVDRGFTLALDDFVWVDGVERLLELASIVKIDLLATPREEVAALMARCRAYDVQLLAEKVETDDDVAWAVAQGFDLFQGYGIERPGLVHGSTIAPSALARVQLALTMLADDLDFDAVEETLRHEPALVLQVLQLASAGADHGLHRAVRSVREALVLLGTVRVRQWIALTILGDQPGGATDGLATALARARMCELLAVRRGAGRPDVAFTVGLLSALDLLLGVGPEHLDASLTLGDDLKAAAFRGEGALGALVTEVASYQKRLRTRAPLDSASDELDTVAASAFAWAMPYVGALAPSS